MKNTKWVKVVLCFVGAVVFMYYCFLPDYRILSSRVRLSDHHAEVEVDAAVYKAHFNDVLYHNIEQEHRRINGCSDKLTINLFLSGGAYKKGCAPFRTVVFDYDRGIEYILVSENVKK